MRQQAYGYAAVTLFCLGITPVAQAELKPISEETMGEVTGQAFMQIENIQDIPGNPHEFTRMTLTMDVETRMNVDDVQAGELDGGVDFAAQHVALGHIARNDGQQFNGRTYSAGDTVHFEAFKPYIELAEDPAEGKLSGFRMGFGQARGSVSSLTSSFSGDIGLKLVSDGQEYDATLMDQNAQATRRRASHIGIVDPAAAPADCTSGAATNCAPLTHLQSLIVGQEGTDGVTDFTNDFFIGFQREGVDWQSPDGANVINASQGVFINLPTSMTVDMGQLITQGVERLQTHRNDMGRHLF
ncbi:hypothetical protein [uncultured Marinobacter sp.]|uniref:hypothetical protein n=1 Tax=uncultured Marinobacter sp. TaxID=187379 RepID=UPI0030C7ACF0